jgi:polyhydroxybutyrate depolymerase
MKPLAALLVIVACSSSTTSTTADAGSGVDAAVVVPDAVANLEDVAVTDDDAAVADDDSAVAVVDGGSADDVTPGDTTSGTPDAEGPKTYPLAPDHLGDTRPASVVLPANYTAAKAWPVLVLLHGYSVNGYLQDAYLGVSARGTTDGFITILPDGTVDAKGNPFWNATDACCNFYGSTVDDDGYLMGLLAEAQTYYNIDPKRIFALGHSNGGFMSYRLACNHSDVFAGVVVLAGAMWNDVADCPATAPVSVLHVHGTSDDTIEYLGGNAGASKFPGAKASAASWAGLDGCDATSTAGDAFDLEASLPGAETAVERWGGCASGAAVELWTIDDGSHLPDFSSGVFAERAMSFLLSHPKP